MIRITRDFLPAQLTTRIGYRANLAQLPKTANFDPTVPNSELIDAVNFTVDPTTAGAGTVAANETNTFLQSSVAGGAITAFDTGGNPVNVQFRWAKTSNTKTAAAITGSAIGNVNDLGAGIAGFNDGAAATVTGSVVGAPGNIGGGATADVTITIGGVANTFDISDAGSDTLAALEAAIDTAFGTDVASIVGGNQLVLTATNKTDTIVITDVDAGAAALAGLTEGVTTNPTAAANDLFRLTHNGINYDFKIGTDTGEFNTLANLVNDINGTATLNNAITADGGGGVLAVTADDVATSFSVAGDANAVAGLGLTSNTFNPGNAGTDIWNLFYLTNSNASGTTTQWLNVGQSYAFGANGLPNPALPNVVISALTVNGVTIGNVTLDHGTTGLSQFADINGTVTVTDINQNGFATGELSSISISDEGRLVGNYTNGETLDISEVTIATFNADNGLSRLDGGAFAATNASGSALTGGGSGSVIAQSLEGSNSDIANEFSKLIVTQQAYAAGTRIVSTADEMLQEALNMVR